MSTIDLQALLGALSSPLMLVMIVVLWKIREDIHGIRLRLVKLETLFDMKEKGE